VGDPGFKKTAWELFWKKRKISKGSAQGVVSWKKIGCEGKRRLPQNKKE